MDYDCIILGGGLSGLAAGIRLAHFGWRVRIFEKQSRAGGLNSFYSRKGHLRDTGLHAMTNFALPGEKSALLNKLFRQLRLNRDEFGFVPQTYSEIQFPSKTLVLTNDFQKFFSQIEQMFPEDAEGFRKLCDIIAQEAYLPGVNTTDTGRGLLDSCIKNETLKDMLAMPVMFYGNPCPNDMKRPMFCTMFRSVLMEGLGRPKAGMVDFIHRLEEKFLQEGGELSLGKPIAKMNESNGKVEQIVDSEGRCHSARIVISTLGLPETERLLEKKETSAKNTGIADEGREHTWQAGRIAFVETLFDLDCAPSECGLKACTVFRNNALRLRFCTPDEAVDYTSELICAPGNYLGCGDNYDSKIVRVSHLANPDFWFHFSEDEYRQNKEIAIRRQIEMLEESYPGFSGKIKGVEMFTPKTVQRFSGRINGAIYGCEKKVYDGKYPGIENLTIAGTDQGILGIIGSMVSGMAVANRILNP